MALPPILHNKWVWIGAGGVFLVVLVASGGKAASSSTSVSGPTDAQVAASRDITLATLNAQVQQGAQAADIAKIQAQGQVDLATAAMNGQLQKYAVDAQVAIQNLQVTSSRDVQLADISSQERRETTSLNTNAQVAKWTLDQATANTQIQANFQLDYAEAANQTNIMLSQMQTELVAQQLVANRDVTLAGLATQTNLAQINSTTQQNITYSNNATQAAIYAGMTAAQVEQARIAADAETARAQIAAGAQKHSNTTGLIGGIIGGVLSIFSDPRLKTDVVPLGMRNDGLGIYAYNYKWGGPMQIGVMADEVDLLRPDAAGPKFLGFGTVYYERLN